MIKKTDTFNKLNEEGREITIDEKYFNDSTLFVLLSIKGIIDTYNSNDFMDSIMKFCKITKRKILVVDIKDVNYMSSTGIGAFIQINKFCRKEKVKLYIMGIQSNVEEVFSLLGFKSFFSYITELDDIKEEKIIRSKFPYKFNCPYCKAVLEIKKTGAYKCAQCKNTFRVTEGKDGKIVVTKNKE